MNEKKGFSTAAILSGLLISGAGLLYKKFKERSKKNQKKEKKIIQKNLLTVMILIKVERSIT